MRPFAERPVRAGLFVVQSAVAVDDVDGADAAVQLIEKGLHAALE